MYTHIIYIYSFYSIGDRPQPQICMICVTSARQMGHVALRASATCVYIYIYTYIHT